MYNYCICKLHLKAFILLILSAIVMYYPGISAQTIPEGSINMQTFETGLHELINAAHNNPLLKAAESKIQASEASVKIQKSLDPPLAAIEFFQSPAVNFPNPFKDQMEYDYSIQQMIPFPGKLYAMASSERKRAEMLKSDRQIQKQDIVRKVKSLYYELYLKDRQIEINQKTHMLLCEIAEITQSRYQVGMGKQSDILRAQTELLSNSNDSIILIQQRKSMEGMLNAICSRPISASIGFIPEIDPVIPEFNLSTLMALALKNRPEIRSMQLNIEMQQAERVAAQKEYLPDFMLKGTYKQMIDNADDWSIMIGATVPAAPWSNGRYSSGKARADANIRGAQSELDNMKSMIASEVNDALLRLNSSRERLMLSRKTAIPQAKTALESVLASYRTGKEELLMLVDIQRMLAMAELDCHMAVMTFLDSQSRLERASGMSIDDIDKSVERGIP